MRRWQVSDGTEAELDRNAKWVPWPDQAPPENAAYLVFMGLTYQWEVAYYDGAWYPCAGDESMITHWMPLPSAPNAKAESLAGSEE